MVSTPNPTAPNPLAPAVLAELRAHMARANLNRSQLADRLSVPRHWVNERLGGTTRITLDDLQQICDGLDVDVTQLIEEAKAVHRG